jgi:hypothetical protein
MTHPVAASALSEFFRALPRGRVGEPTEIAAIHAAARSELDCGTQGDHHASP